jgi:uncharacterized membrane protein
MKPFLRILFFLALAGLLFSGYLSAVKLFSGSCAFNEPCPYFLGYPACWYGFAMYLFMFITASLGFAGKISPAATLKASAVVSFIGILFAGSFVVQELVFSTCFYGLVFYIAIFITSLVGLLRRHV